ncbi:hypothetical protein [Embleya sp. AB8]|uniref:hypothetical protein n=1 Tax=Embleya sp. AB8 TaxID=3156304 RepID=UPI003C7525BE
MTTAYARWRRFAAAGLAARYLVEIEWPEPYRRAEAPRVLGVLPWTATIAVPIAGTPHTATRSHTETRSHTAARSRLTPPN